MEDALARKPFDEGRLGGLALRILIALAVIAAGFLAGGDSTAAQDEADTLAIYVWLDPSPRIFAGDGQEISRLSTSTLPAPPVQVVALMNPPDEGRRSSSALQARVGFLHDGALVYVAMGDVGLTFDPALFDGTSNENAAPRGRLTTGTLDGLTGAALGRTSKPGGAAVTARLSDRYRLPVCPGDPRCAGIAPEN